MTELSRRDLLNDALGVAGLCVAGTAINRAAEAEENKNELSNLLAASDRYITQHKERWIREDLGPLLSIRSISERGENKKADEEQWKARKEVLEFLASKLKKFGATIDGIYERDNEDKDESKRKRNAFLVAHLNSKDKKAFTLLQYGHADVKPETAVLRPEDRWTCSSPTQFVEKSRSLDEYIQEVTLKIDGRDLKDKQICARGAADDKGQLLTYLFGAETYLNVARNIPINLKFFFEVGEEAGSPLGKEFVRDNTDLLKADTIILEDGLSIRYGVPFIAYWLRGGIKGHIRVKTANNSGHSGGKGYLPNALEKLILILSQLEDNETGKINFSEAYDGIRSLTTEEKEYFRLQLSKFDEDAVKRKLEISKFAGEVDYPPLVRTTQRPSLDIHNISGGSNSTLIANKAEAYFTMRVVPDQDPVHLYEGLERKVKSIAKNVGLRENEIEIELREHNRAFTTQLNHPIFRIISKSLMMGFGVNEIDYIMEGGTEPISSAFKDYLRVPTIMTGGGDPDGNMHAKDERMLVDMGIIKLVRSNVAMYYNLAKIR